MLRWSRPNAAVLLELPQTHRFRIELDLGNLRTWKTDLSEHLRFTFDGVPLDEVNVTSKKPLLRLEIPEFTELPKSGRLYKLEWTCHKVFPSPDPRPLGLPVLSVHARGLGKRASTDHSDPDHAPSQVSTPTCSAPHHG